MRSIRRALSLAAALTLWAMVLLPVTEAGIKELRQNAPSPEPSEAPEKPPHTSTRHKHAAAETASEEGTQEEEESGSVESSATHAGPAAAGAAYTERARQAVDAHSYDEGIQLAQQALAHGEDKSGAYLQLARGEYYKHDLNGATEHVRLGMAAGPSSRLYNLRGVIARQQGKRDRALADFQRASQMDPRDGRPRMNLGMIHADRRLYRQAITAIEEARRLLPKDAAVNEALAGVYEMMGAVPQAVETLDRARLLDPTNTGLIKRLAHLRMRTSWARIDGVTTQHNASLGGRNGLLIHFKLSVHGLRNRSGIACAFFEYSTGTALHAKAGSAYRTAQGLVATSLGFTPQNEDTTFNDFQLFIPYDELNMAKGHSSLSYWVQVRDTPTNSRGIGSGDRQYFDFDQR